MKKRSKRLVLLASVLVLAAAVVGGSLAWLQSSTQPLTNEFTYAATPIDIPENFDGQVKRDVKVHNEGNVPAYVRAKVVVTWKDADGNVSAKPITESDYTMAMGEGWFEKDGIWYCKTAVAPGQDSPVFITEAKKAEGAARPEGFDLSIEVMAQSIQAEGMQGEQHMVEAMWPVTVNDSGVLAPKA